MDPDNLATAPDLEDDGLYDFFARYVRRVHSDDFIRKALLKTPKTSFVDIIGPSDIAYVISIIKNSGEVWSQDVKMVEMGVRVMGNREKKKKPLFTQGEGAKRVNGESLWNIEGRKYFAGAEAKWREIYNNEEQMKVIYNRWEVWIETKGKEINIGDGSRKTFTYVMGTWYVMAVETINESDDEEEGDSGYALDRGRGRESLGWAKGALREMKVVEEIGKGTDSDDVSNESNESNKKRKGGKTLVFKQAAAESPAHNTRKRAAAAESPAVKKGRGKK